MSDDERPSPDASDAGPELEALQRQVESLTRDMDALATALEESRASEELLRAIVNTANIGVVVTQRGITKFVNDYVIKASGYTRQELSNFSFSEFLHPDDRKVVFDRHLRRLAGEDVEPNYAFRSISKSGETRVVETTSVLIDWEGEPASLNFLRDVTERHQARAEHQHSRRLEAIGTLAGGIAHDFNNILGQIIGFTDLARYSVEPDSRTTEHLERVMQASSRARDLVQRILAFSRQSEQVRKPVALDNLVARADVLLRASIPTTIEIVFDSAPRGSTVMGDPTQLEQVLVNLCTNASQAMEATGGTLTVTVGPHRVEAGDVRSPEGLPPGDYVLLRVVDTGLGMDEHTRERIFDPYFTTKQPGRGTGLGLAVAQSIVQKHGGAIQVKSALGEGATFDVLLPRIPDGSGALETPAQLRVFPGTERLLLVDDEEPLVDLGTQLLSQFGYRVTGCSSPEEALALFQESPDAFDAIITDFTMPELTGDQLAAELLAIRPELPLILVTGFSERMDREQAMAAGFAAYLKKPLDLPELTRSIRLALGEELGE